MLKIAAIHDSRDTMAKAIHLPMKQSLRDILSAEEHEVLRSRARRETYNPDDLIFEESAPSDKLYLVESGEVSVFIHKYLETLCQNSRKFGKICWNLATFKAVKGKLVLIRKIFN